MSIIQTIRDKGSWVILIAISVAIIAFIFADPSNNSGNSRGGENKTIGTVDGSKIKNKEYSARYDAMLAAYENNPQVSKDQIEGFVWRSMVDEKLINSELSKYDIGLDDKVLADIAIGKYGQPSPHVTQLFRTIDNTGQIVDQQSQQLNTAAAEQVLKQMKSQGNGNEMAQKFIYSFNALLPIVKYEYLLAKYSSMFMTTNYAPKWMVKKRMSDDNSMVNLSFVQIPYADINDSTIAEAKVTDADIKNYMSKYTNLFKTSETIGIDYITFDFKPTSSDSATLFTELTTKKNSLNTTTDSLAGVFVMNNNSLIPFTDQYVRKKDVMINDSNAVLNDNASFGPYVRGNDMVVAKVIENKNYPDTASARHILILMIDPQTGQPTISDSIAKSRIDSIELAYKGGVSFDSLAKKFSQDPSSKDSGGLVRNISFDSRNFDEKFNDFVLTNGAGQTSIIKAQYGYHFVKTEGTKGSVKPAYKVAYLAKAITPSTNTRDSAMGLANAFAANNRTGAAFDDYFKKNPSAVKMNGYEINRENLQISGLNDDVRDICKWAFTSKINEVSQPFSLDNSNKVVVAKLALSQNEGIQSIETVKANPSVMNSIRNEKKYTYIAKKYGTVASLEDIASKSGKQVIVNDSVSFQSAAVLIGARPEERIAGAALNKAYQTKVSGAIKGNNGVFYVKANGPSYIDTKASTDELTYQKQLEQKMVQQAQQTIDAFRKKAKITDKRLENRY
jgi:peptidyl-prolyl cis-trans isomerase D